MLHLLLHLRCKRQLRRNPDYAYYSNQADKLYRQYSPYKSYYTAEQKEALDLLDNIASWISCVSDVEEMLLTRNWSYLTLVRIRTYYNGYVAATGDKNFTRVSQCITQAINELDPVFNKIHSQLQQR